MLRWCQRAHSSPHDKDTKVSLTFGLGVQNKAPAIHHSGGEGVALSCSNTAPCNQSINQWIDKHDSPASSPSVPQRRSCHLHGNEKRMDCRNQSGDNKQKSPLDAQVCCRGGFGCIPAMQQWIIPQQHTYKLPAGVNGKNSLSKKKKRFTIPEGKYCTGAHTSQIALLSACTGRLSI